MFKSDLQEQLYTYLKDQKRWTPPGVRQIARDLEKWPQSVQRALADLRTEGLIDENNKPLK